MTPQLMSLIGILVAVGSVTCALMTISTVYNLRWVMLNCFSKDFKRAKRSLFLAALTAVTALASASMAFAVNQIKATPTPTIIVGDAKTEALGYYIKDRLTPIQDAWWWEIKPADRMSDATKEELFRYQNLFNQLLETKCESKEQWPEYYEKVIAPLLWDDVSISKASPVINSELTVKDKGDERVLEKFLANDMVFIKDAWWWKKIASDDRMTDETQKMFWEYHDIFNAHLPEKCESQEQWDAYYKKMVAPCLWTQVYVSRTYEVKLPELPQPTKHTLTA